MPLFRLETKMRYLTYDTGNRWYVNSDTLDTAINVGIDIVEALRPVTYTGVEFYRIRASTPAADGRTGRTADISTFGTKPMTRRLPPVECAMLKLSPFATDQSMNFKFLRWCVSADEQQDGQLTNLALEQLQDAASALLAVVGLYTARNSVISTVTVDRYTHARDFNRAWGDRTPKEGSSAAAKA